MVTYLEYFVSGGGGGNADTCWSSASVIVGVVVCLLWFVFQCCDSWGFEYRAWGALRPFAPPKGVGSWRPRTKREVM
jgi:hypothetical protein